MCHDTTQKKNYIHLNITHIHKHHKKYHTTFIFLSFPLIFFLRILKTTFSYQNCQNIFLMIEILTLLFTCLIGRVG